MLVGIADWGNDTDVAVVGIVVAAGKTCQGVLTVVGASEVGPIIVELV